MGWGAGGVGGREVRKLSETNMKYLSWCSVNNKKMSFHDRGDQERISPVNSAS